MNMKTVKINGYKPYEGCPKCGDYEFESFIDGFDFFNYKDDEYIAVHHVATCDCGYRYKFDEVYKYHCDIIKE